VLISRRGRHCAGPERLCGKVDGADSAERLEESCQLTVGDSFLACCSSMAGQYNAWVPHRARRHDQSNDRHGWFLYHLHLQQRRLEPDPADNQSVGEAFWSNKAKAVVWRQNYSAW